MLVPVLLFLLGFALLIKGGDWFVDGSVGIARRFHLPELLIGATIVSIGTTLPEVMVSTQAAMQGNAGISYGNAIGSIICNTSLIAAITVSVSPGKVQPRSFILPTAFFFAAALSYAGVAWTLGRFTRWMGLLYLAVFAAYMILSVAQMKKNPALAEEDSEETDAKERSFATELLLLVVGSVSPAMHKYIWVPAWWVIRHKMKFWTKKKYSMYELKAVRDLRDGKVTKEQLDACSTCEGCGG